MCLLDEQAIHLATRSLFFQLIKRYSIYYPLLPCRVFLQGVHLENRGCLCADLANMLAHLNAVKNSYLYIYMFSPFMLLRSTCSLSISILLALAWIAPGKAVAHEVSAEEWLIWKARHQRRYSSMEDETKRYKIWLHNKKFIDEHNSQADAMGYHVAMNHFSDLVS